MTFFSIRVVLGSHSIFGKVLTGFSCAAIIFFRSISSKLNSTDILTRQPLQLSRAMYMKSGLNVEVSNSGGIFAKPLDVTCKLNGLLEYILAFDLSGSLCLYEMNTYKSGYFFLRSG